MIAQRKQFEEKKLKLKSKQLINEHNKTADSSMSNISVGLTNAANGNNGDDQNENYRYI